MSLVVRVFDPREGRTVALNVYHDKSGDLHIRRLPDHNFRGNETPRMNEQRAAFIEVASSTYDQHVQDGEFPTWRALRAELPERARSFRAPRQSKRAQQQDHYRELVGPGIIQAVESQGAERVHVRLEAPPQPEFPSPPAESPFPVEHRPAHFPSLPP